MTRQQADDFVVAATATECGMAVLRDLYSPQGAAIIRAAPRGARDDAAAIQVATALQRELHRRYPTVF